jgi:hypothetical protein
MKTDKIYIKLIDGTESWIPINARQIDHNRYIILDDPEFDNLSSTILFEFYSGDIVKIAQQTFSDGTIGFIAKEIIANSLQPDRKYCEFMFLAVMDKLPIDQNTRDKYRQEIERIKKEKGSGQFFYPKVLDTIDKLDRLIKHGSC